MHSFLRGTRVVEVSLLAPDIAGQHLADLGADVVKVEGPPLGDYVRRLGTTFVGGLSVLHLRWNRGKRSVWLDLKSERGRSLFLELVSASEVVIDGLRAGALDRLGLGWEQLRARQPSLVYCSLSGLGRSGPYSRLATHGVFYDAYAGLAPPAYPSEDGIPRLPRHYTAVGIEAAGLYGALGVVAALAAARQSGQGSLVEVAEADAAVAWTAGQLDAALNGAEPVGGAHLGQSVRYSYYRTKDDGLIVFQASEAKFWDHFCRAVGRPDLLERFPSAPVGDHARGNETLRKELQELFSTRTRAEWTELFVKEDIPGGPAYPGGGVIEDPHFQARGLTYRVTDQEGTERTFFGSPLKVEGEELSPLAAPTLGQHTGEVLAQVLGLGPEEIEAYLAEFPPPPLAER